MIEVIVPHLADTVPSTPDPDEHCLSDCHVALMAEWGRIDWKRGAGCVKRNHAETTVGRYKLMIGLKLLARSRPAQLGKVALAVSVLNYRIRGAKLISVCR